VFARTEDAFWLVTLAAGVVAGLLFTRLARSLAARAGLVDSPDGRRKIQARPVPVAGGIAVLLAALTALGVAAAASPAVAAALTADARQSLALLAAAVLIVAVGLADDRFNLRARYKLLGQAAAALVLIVPGHFVIERLGVFGWLIDLGPLAIPVTLFWLLACVNALNLIDGMDGMLGTVGVIALVCLAVMAGNLGNTFTVVVALALAGAVVGFLRYNLPPASIYMGDAGSMLIGLVLGALAVSARLKGPATGALGASVALVLLPVLDTTAAIVRRKLTGRGLATADRGHLHHVLLRSGLSVRRALLVVAGLALIASAGALASTALNNDLFALIAVAGVVVTLTATRLFGHAEFKLVKQRALGAWRTLRPGGGQDSGTFAVHLQGTADWDEVWNDLTGCAAQMNLRSVRLDVNAPALHEDYHARWGRHDAGDLTQWALEIPLYGHGQVIGRLTVAGVRDDEPIVDKMLTVAKIIEIAEEGAAHVTSRHARPVAVAVAVAEAQPG
jgi:UDP-GlcNAc:undecaprenyl-phosphate GlcNAc-1-phosphate transferase